MNRQQGMALMISLSLLLVLSLIAMGLLSNSRTMMRMTAATLLREQALQRAYSAQESLILEQISKQEHSVFVVNDAVQTVNSGDQQHPNVVTFLGQGTCPRLQAATAVGVMTCRYNEVETKVRFGRENRGQLSVFLGVQQSIPPIGNDL